MRLLDGLFLIERHLTIPSGIDCYDCPFYQCGSETGYESCSNGMFFSADVTEGKRNAECLKEFPNGATIWFEKGKQK